MMLTINNSKPEWESCQAFVDTLDGAWIAADSFGLILCANTDARRWLNGNLSPHDQKIISSFIHQLSCRQSDFGLLPLSDVVLVGFSSACPWQKQINLVNLKSTNRENSITCNARLIKQFSEALRDPVSKLDLFAYLITQGRQDRQEFYKETLTKETARMIRFIDNLSLIAQMMAGPAEKVIPVAHCEMVQDMYNYFESFLTEEGVSVEIDYSDGGAYVLANSRLLCRAIQNILANIPRSKAGENRVSIQVERDGLWARIKLNEPGFYIKKDDLAVLFEPFENGKIDLDLVVVRSIINHHQGFISARLVDGLVYFDFWIPPYLKETEQSVIKPEFVALNIV